MNRCVSKLKAIIAFSIIWWGLKTTAQQTPAYASVSTTQGLSQGMVFDILQDKEGFIWVATKNGLNRYDGYDFKIFTNDPYNAYTLSSNTIVKLFEDSKGRIWAGTDNAGLNIFDKKSGNFYRIVHNNVDAAGLSGNRIRSITELSNGKMLIATDDGGLNIVELPVDFFSKDAAPIITRLRLPGGAQVYGMGNDNKGITWITYHHRNGG